jgi:mono/diheme cytochrome c family protein
MAKHQRGLFTIVCACLLLAVGCAGKQTPKTSIEDPGQLLFNGYGGSAIDCYRCHGGDATGTWRGPDLVKRVPTLTDAAIGKAIYEGPGMMPSFKGKINDAQIAFITGWLRTRAAAAAKKP